MTDPVRTPRELSEIIWAKFRAVEEPTLIEQIDQALGLVQHWPTVAQKMHLVCGSVLGTATDYPCMLLDGHIGPHESIGARWGARSSFEGLD